MFRLHTGEGLLAASNYNSTNVLIFVIFRKSFVELAEEGAAESIEGLGAVESDC